MTKTASFTIDGLQGQTNKFRPGRSGLSLVMGSYSIPDLLKLLRAERGDCVRLEVGFSPTLIVKGEVHEIEGPAVFEESVEEMLLEMHVGTGP